MTRRIVIVCLVSLLLVSALAPAALAAEPLTHTVKRGETLSWIAWRYGLTVPELVEANKLTSGTRIYVGQKLSIPVDREEYTEYTVKAGDTLLSIAARYGVKVWDIARLNGIWNTNLVFPGKKLLIPGGAEQAPAPAVKAPVKQAEIVISSPTENSAVTSPVTVTGWGSGFENSLAVDVLDEKGQVLGQGFVTITAEIGQSGPFTGTVEFKAPAAAQTGRVSVYRISARDGAIEALSSVTVQLKPASK